MTLFVCTCGGAEAVRAINGTLVKALSPQAFGKLYENWVPCKREARFMWYACYCINLNAQTIHLRSELHQQLREPDFILPGDLQI